MIGALIIVFREIIEAGLIVGIILAVTRGTPGRSLWVLGGCGAGIIGSGLLASFIGVLSDAFNGMGQELFQSVILAFAVIMLGWHNFWMAKHGRAMAAELRQAGIAAATGVTSMAALSFVVATAFLREGAEVVLFVYGQAVAEQTSASDIALGATLGLLLGAGLSALIYFSLIAIPMQRLFAVTSTLVSFLAAGMAAQCVAFLQQAGLLTILSQKVWDTSAFLPDKSLLGRVAHALIGYTDRPTGLQLLVYCLVLMILLGGVWSARRGASASSTAGSRL